MKEILIVEDHPFVAEATKAMDRADFAAQLEEAGFLGYIPKAMPAPALSAALAEVIEGRGVFHDSATTASSRSSARLTRRQAEVLDLVRRGYSSKQVAAAASLTEGTVNSHVNAVINELQASSRSHAVAKAIELGLLRV